MAEYFVHAVINPPITRFPWSERELELLIAFGWEVLPCEADPNYMQLASASGWRDEVTRCDLVDQGVDIGAVAALGEEFELGPDDYLGVWEFLQHLVRRAAMPYLIVELAFTCSKMRPEGFGGAAYIITADEVESMSTQEWVERTLKKKSL